METLLLGENPEMGTVVERRYDEEQSLTYVVKRIRYLDSPLSRTIFLKETSALKRLKACENIVRFYGEDVQTTEDGRSEGIISMEYVPGITLRRKAESIPTNAIRYRLVQQLMHAIHYAHEESVIHRDINPNNILVTEDYTLKLIDFGISKICGVAVTSGTTYQFATKGYAAPEVTSHSENATTRSDIYSAGAVIFFLFTGIDPPPPEQICEAISSTGGMDVELKEILGKMCAPAPKDRYETIDDCESEFFPLYLRYCTGTENYYFSIPYEKVETLKSQHIVPKYLRYEDIISTNLPERFCPCSARIDRNGTYCFDGKGVTMECIYKDGLFHVANFKRLEVYRQERYKRFSFPLEGRFHFIAANRLSTFRAENNSGDKLKVKFDEFEHDLTSKQNIDAEYEQQYGGVWKQYVTAMIADAREQARHIRYDHFELREDGKLLLYLNPQENLLEEDYTQETVFAYEKENKKRDNPNLIEVGTFLEYLPDDGILALSAAKNASGLPTRGSICIDYWREIQQYRRQDAALDSFKRSETFSDGDLKGIITGIQTPGRFCRQAEIPFFNTQLDRTQKNAVKKILEATDIALVQGPPGTGKTNVLVEVVRQILRQGHEGFGTGNKILIVSQSHAAVDKLLEDLIPYIGDATAIRIGSEDKISEQINKIYGLNSCQQLWVEASTERCGTKLSALLAERNIGQEEFVAFAEAMEGLKIQGAGKRETERLEDVVLTFEAASHMTRDDPFLRRCLTIDRWRRHLAEDSSLAEYYIKNADIVAGTCSGFISNHFVRDISFHCVIVDEAAKATLSELMVPIVRAEKVILVGDHKQLPPVLDEEAMRRSALPLEREKLLAAGFESIWKAMPDICKETLTTQYRMHPTIGTLISEMFYGNEVQNGVSAEKRLVELPSLYGYAITWLSTSSLRGDRAEKAQPGSNGRRSFTNPLEITVLQQYLMKLDSEAEGASYTIGVITPYAAQVHLIHKRLQSIDFRNIQVDVNTVDAFQGSQRDIIIYSTVRSNTKRTIGFLDKEARLNVALSRAERALIIIGDARFFEDTKIPRNILLPILNYIRSNPRDCRILPAGEVQ